MTTSPSALPAFDVDQIPFSRRGSWLNLSRVTGLHTRKPDIHLVSHQTGMTGVLVLRPLQGAQPIAAEVTADAAELTWSTETGSVRAVFDGLDTVRLRGENLSLAIADAADELTPFTGAYLFQDPIDGSAVFTSYETGRRYRITPIAGELTIAGAERLGAGERSATLSGDRWEAVVEEYETGRAPYVAERTFEEAVAEVRAEFADYVDLIAPWRNDTTPAAVAAAYVVWSATVAPSGFLKRESVLMSKHWMDKVWSWDHCFNAFALAGGLPDVALDQFLTPFDHQESSGALPDSVTHSERLYNFVKPPMHGWALRKLRGLMSRELTREELADIFAKLSRWADFWLDSRRAPGHELPSYQHGNDSGWDNSTMFDHDRLVDAPDLAAFLAILLDELASLADELGVPSDGRRSQAERVRDALLDELWTGEGFVAKGTLSGVSSKTASLLTMLPIVDAEALGPEVIDVVAGQVSAILTEWGPATEPVTSPDYESDGYWRGPIWAPSTVIVEDGLRRAGRTDVADAVSERFRRLCETSGFAENFDALTGEGLRDRAYTWTASAYLLLASEAVARG